MKEIMLQAKYPILDSSESIEIIIGIPEIQNHINMLIIFVPAKFLLQTIKTILIFMA